MTIKYGCGLPEGEVNTHPSVGVGSLIKANQNCLSRSYIYSGGSQVTYQKVAGGGGCPFPFSLWIWEISEVP